MKYAIIITGLLLLGCSKGNSEQEAPIKQTDPRVVSLASPSGHNARLPFLTSDGGKQLYLSWVEVLGNHKVFKYARLTGNQWSDKQDIFEGPELFLNWADYPMIGVNQSGNTMANYMVISSEEKLSNNIHTVGKTASGSWSKPSIPHTDRSLVQHGFVSIIPSADNDFEIAWLDGREGGSEGDEHYGEMTLQATTANIEGKIGEEQVLDDYVCSCCQISGAMTAHGPMLVYRDRSRDEVRDISTVRLVNGVWTEPKTIYEDHWTIAGCPVNGPQIDARGNNVAIAWFTAPENQPEVKVIFSEDGGESFGAPIMIDDGFPIGRVDLVMLDETSAVVSWLAKQADQTLIKAQVVHTTGQAEPAFTIAESSSSRASGFPQMTKIGNRLYFAWTHLLEDESTEIKLASVELYQ